MCLCLVGGLKQLDSAIRALYLAEFTGLATKGITVNSIAAVFHAATIPGGSTDMAHVRCSAGEPTLQRVRVSSAAPGHPRLRQISKAALQMRGAFWDTYMRSATREKLSTLALEMNAWAHADSSQAAS